MKLGVALGGHSRSFEELLGHVRRAEELGYAAAFVDGDVSVVESRGDGDVLDGWTTTALLLARTERIPIGSIRLVQHWNAARLAQAVATLERLAPGRLRVLLGAGDQAADPRFGLRRLAPDERVAHMEETLDAVRALWRGEDVTRRGRFVSLERARVRPVVDGRFEVAVAARRPRLLGVVARHADVWDVNLPPVAARVHAAGERLAAACRAVGRDPASVGRWMWIFVRPDRDPDDPALARAFRRANPWFREVGDDELGEAIVAGSADACRARLEAIARDLAIDLPVVDCSYLDAAATAPILEALAPRGGTTGPD